MLLRLPCNLRASPAAITTLTCRRAPTSAGAMASINYALPPAPKPDSPVTPPGTPEQEPAEAVTSTPDTRPLGYFSHGASPSDPYILD